MLDNRLGGILIYHLYLYATGRVCIRAGRPDGPSWSSGTVAEVEAEPRFRYAFPSCLPSAARNVYLVLFSNFD